MHTLSAAAPIGEKCVIHEMSGPALAHGTIVLRTRNALDEFVSVRLDEPGQLVQRCLVDGVHDVLVAVNGRPLGRATVDRLALTADEGEVCVLCLPLPDRPPP